MEPLLNYIAAHFKEYKWFEKLHIQVVFPEKYKHHS